MRVFKCKECGHTQDQLIVNEEYVRNPSGWEEFIGTDYIFECGHIENFKEDLKVIEVEGGELEENEFEEE